MANGFASSKSSVNQGSMPQSLPLTIDAELVQAQWQSQFAKLEDLRSSQGVEHPFLSIVIIAILAVIGGATGWEDIETYAESHEVWLSTPFGDANRVPHTDTYRRLFEEMAPAALEQCFLDWMK